MFSGSPWSCQRAGAMRSPRRESASPRKILQQAGSRSIASEGPTSTSILPSPDALEEKGSFPWRPAAAAAVFLLALFLLPLLPDGSQPAVNSVVTNGSGTVTSLSTGNPAFEQWLDEVLANQLKAVTPTPEQG